MTFGLLTQKMGIQGYCETDENTPRKNPFPTEMINCSWCDSPSVFLMHKEGQLHEENFILAPTTIYLFVKYSHAPMNKNSSSLETGNGVWLLDQVDMDEN